MLWATREFDMSICYKNTSDWYPLRNKINYCGKHIEDGNRRGKKKIQEMVNQTLKELNYYLMKPVN